MAFVKNSLLVFAVLFFVGLVFAANPGHGIGAIDTLADCQSKYLKINALGNGWECDVPSGTGGGDITGVTAGTGLSGGGTTGTVSVSLNTAGLASGCGTATTGKIYWDSTNSRLGCATDQTGGGGSSQWITSGTLIYYNAGNVGIGTSTPSQKLQVSGRISTYTAANQFLNMYSEFDVTSLIWSKTAPGGGLRFGTWDTVSGGNYATAMIVTNSGNVGIGTTAPAEKLQVSGNIRGTQLCIGSDCRSAWPSGSGSGITQLSQGNGITLTPNPITSTGTISANTTYLQRRVTPGCTLPNQSIKTINENGSVTCEIDDATTVNSTLILNNAPQGTMCGSRAVKREYHWNISGCGYKAWDAWFDQGTTLVACAGYPILSGAPDLCVDTPANSDCPLGYQARMIAYEHVPVKVGCGILGCLVDTQIFSAFYSCLKT